MAEQGAAAEAAGQPSDAGADEEGAAQEEKPEPIPDDIMPLFFTTLTQQIFECTGGTDVTSENPWKLIQKEKILEDFKNRAAISDFHPAKQTILVRIFSCIRQYTALYLTLYFVLVIACRTTRVMRYW